MKVSINNGLKEGYGTFKWPHGKTYKGKWKQGKQHGEGMIDDGKDNRRGIWKNGT